MAGRTVRWGIGAMLLLAGAGWPGWARGQELPHRAYDRCIRSAVSIVAPIEGEQDSVMTGSGTLIDPRGYVLTNFHVVGRTQPGEGGMTGDLFHSQGYVLLGMVGSDREAVQHTWIGQVVRGDPTLDLALVRIVKQARDGTPVGQRRFPFVPFAPSRSVRVGEAVWAIGFPLGTETVNVTAGNVSSFVLNLNGQVAWIRTDAEFNPGNSGGMLVDRKCRLVGVPSIVTLPNQHTRAISAVERARPISRVPREWLRAMRGRRMLQDLRITDVPSLDVSRPLRTVISGDLGEDRVNGDYWYHLPSLRPARVVIEGPRFFVKVSDARGNVVAQGRGAVRIPAHAPPRLDLQVQAPLSAKGARLTLHFLAEQAPMRFARATTASSGGAGSGLQGDLVPLGPPGRAGGTASAAGVVRLVGQVTSVSGRPVSGAMIMLGKPGVDMQVLVNRLGNHQITREQFAQAVAGRARSDGSGRFVLQGATPGATQMIVAAAENFGMGVEVVRVPHGQSVVQVPVVTLNP